LPKLTCPLCWPAYTAALSALGLWLFLDLLWPMLAQILGQVIAPPDIRFTALGLPTPDTFAWQSALARVAPSRLFDEVLVAMLNPDLQSLSTLLAQFQGRIPSPLPLDQSIIQAWPPMVGLIAGTIVVYVVGYIAFQRQEVRA
jgi:ABC-2 type transport system permease protein